MTPAEREIARQRRALMRIESNGMSEVARSYQVVLKDLQANLGKLTDRIEQARAAGIEVRPGWLAAEERYRSLIGQHERQTLDYLRECITTIREGKGAAIAQANGDAPRLTAATMGPAPAASEAAVANSFSQLPADQMRRLLANAADGRPLGNLLYEIAPEATQKVKDALNAGVARGASVRTIAADVTKASGLAQNRALLITRTEVIRAYRETAFDLYRSSPVVNGWVWIAEVNACPVCSAEHGSEHTEDETLESHPACFPAGTAVSGPTPTGATTRRYDGDLLDIRFAGGGLLSVTPNHPILTPRGWVAAGALREGDDVIRCGGREGSGAGHPNDHKWPAFIEQVPKALRSAGNVSARTVPGSPEQLHGDGGHGDVDVVWTERLGQGRRESSLLQQAGEIALSLGGVGLLALAGFGALHALGPRRLSALTGAVGSLGVAPILLGGACGHQQPVGIGAPANFNARFLQAAADRGSTHSERSGDGVLGLPALVALDDLRHAEGAPTRQSYLPMGQRASLGGRSPNSAGSQGIAQAALADSMPSRADLARLAGDVVTDRVLDVAVRRFRGHVYNVETVAGWYIANDTIVHNCRCSAMPKTVSWADLGFPEIPTRRPSITPGPERFAALPEADRLAILGRSRFDAYERGAVTLEEMVRPTNSARWGAGKRVATLEELGVG